MGHFLTAMLLGWNTDKIYIYPYGGFSKFSDDLNKPIKEEFLVLIMGPIVQIITYLILSSLGFRDVKIYHYAILLFNLLPIYPLDGGKLMHLFFLTCTSYQKSYKITIYISYFFFLVLSVTLYQKAISLQLLMMLCLILTKLTEEAKKTSYYFQKFLLERYLKNYQFKHRKVITNLQEMRKEVTHLFYRKGKYYSEKEMLKQHFKSASDK